MTDADLLTAVLTFLSLAVAVVGIVSTISFRKQSLLSQQFRDLHHEIQTHEKRLSDTREEMIQYYVRHQDLRSILEELKRTLSAELSGTAAEINSAVSAALRTHAEEEAERNRKFFADLIKGLVPQQAREAKPHG